MPNPSTRPVQAPSRSARFFQECVVFEIEGTSYRVPKHGFEKYSHSFFRDLFALPQGSEGSREGDSEENPIRPPQVAAAEFDSLLEVVYPLALTAWPPKFSKEQWTGVLRLSRQWDMPEVASLAIKQLNDLDLSAIEKVKLGKAHGVPHWLKDGYTTLVGDVSGAVSLEDLETLGLRTALRIVWAQNQTCLSVKPSNDGSNMYCGYCIRNMRGTIQTLKYHPAEGTGTYRCNDTYRCNSDPKTSGYGAYTLVDFSDSKPLANSSVADKVAEVFKDEIEEAERRNASPTA